MIAGQIDRELWEQPGYTIAEHTNSGPQEWAVATNVVIHYTAATYQPDSYEAVRQSLRNMQRDYVINRGYSLGYNWCVDRAGRVWEIRGADFRCGANGNLKNNRMGPAILCLVSGQDPANDLMLASAHHVIRTCWTAAGRQLEVIKHSEIRPTQCPGVGLSAQVDVGAFTPKELKMVTYIATPPAQYRSPHRGSFLVEGANVRYATTRDVEWAKTNLVPEIVLVPEQYELLYRQVFGALPA